MALTKLTRSGADLHDAIRHRAREIYIRSGRTAGRDLENWAQAEREIQRKALGEELRSAVVVKVDGVLYVGEYTRELSQGYLPGEFGEGMTVPVRFDGDRMFVTRPNGMELETFVVKVG